MTGQDAYIAGFTQKCAEFGFSPAALVKESSPAHLKAVAQKLLAMHAKPPARDIGKLQEQALAVLRKFDPKGEGDLFGHLRTQGGFVMPERGLGNRVPRGRKHFFGNPHSVNPVMDRGVMDVAHSMGGGQDGMRLARGFGLNAVHG